MSRPLVKYAGYDLDEALRNMPKRDKRRSRQVNGRAFALFNQGFDTFDIAAILCITEARALRIITRSRCLARGLPSPYEVRK